jgi:hypothetical protein
MSKFVAMIEFKDGRNEAVEVELEKEDIALTYDEVLDAVFNLVDTRYGYDINDENDPYSIVDIQVILDDGTFPVVSESETKKLESLRANKNVSKFLVLPDAVYSLSPQYKAFMQMKLNGLLKDHVEFDDVEEALRVIEDVEK